MKVCTVCEFGILGKAQNLWVHCHALCSTVYFRSRMLLYSAGSGVSRVQVVLSGFSVRLFCFVQATTLCRYGCMYFFAALVLVCVDIIVMSSA